MIQYPGAIKGVHISPMGIIPKRNRPGKWRLIVDMSSPHGASLNDGIEHWQSSLSYSTIDHLSTFILSAGQGVFLTKVDIKEAYLMVPVHPEDQPLLGILLGGGAECIWTGSFPLDCDPHPKFLQHCSGYCTSRGADSPCTT